MGKLKSYKSVQSFTKEVLDLDSYDSWLVTTKNKIIALIVKEREEQGISQTELAQLLGTTQSVISRIESGMSKSITLDYLMKIVCVLGLSSSHVLDLFHNPPN